MALGVGEGDGDATAADVPGAVSDQGSTSSERRPWRLDHGGLRLVKRHHSHNSTPLQAYRKVCALKQVTETHRA